MIHVVFNESDVNVLNEAMALDDVLSGEVLQVKDDYAVGPLANIYSDEGIADREAWWREVLSGGDLDGHVDAGMVNDRETISQLIDTLNNNPEEQAWIWAAPNKHDVCGYYWMLDHLKPFQGRIMILYLHNLPFFNDKGNIFYPAWLHTIPPTEFRKARKLAREITTSEFEIDPDEWTRICEAGKGVRLLEGGKKISQADYDFYDAELKKFITGEWQKASRIIHQFISKSKETTGDMYLLWRLKVMLAQDMFDVQGKVGNMKEFELKIKESISI